MKMETLQYQYAPLKDSKTDIRIAIIQPGRFDDEIRIAFCTRRLKNKVPKYDCLSYAWGNPDQASHARVGISWSSSVQEVIPISRNLDSAIRYIRDAVTQRLFWIDALCIDQQNTVERNEQVAQMAQIYRLASRVVIWLGEEADNSDKGLELLQLLSRKAKISDRSWLRSHDHGMEEDWADESVPLPFENGELDSISALTKRPYFRRAWVRQEVALAREAVVKIGLIEMPWSQFRDGMIYVYLKPYSVGAVSAEQEAGFHDALTAANDLCKTEPGQVFYTGLRMSLREILCQDPRDRIYAMMSLLQPEDQQIGITADYSLSVEEIYTNVTRSVCLFNNDLSLLGSCELSSITLDIPSWVPDWSSRSLFSQEVVASWSACAWISGHLTPIGQRAMRAVGTTVADIESVIDLDIGKEPYGDEDLFQTLQRLKPNPDVIERDFGTEESCIELHCRACIIEQFANQYEPPESTSLPDFAESVSGLARAWTRNESWEEHRQADDALPDLYMSRCLVNFIGRCLIRTTGYVGVAPTGTRVGDKIAILLGSRWPVILRLDESSQSDPGWQVVGVCYVPGIMHGEIIYRNNFTENHRPVLHLDEDLEEAIDGLNCSLFDESTGERLKDPVKLLVDAGIHVDSYQHSPHVLEVRQESLDAVGIAMEEFVLI